MFYIERERERKWRHTWVDHIPEDKLENEDGHIYCEQKQKAVLCTDNVQVSCEVG